MGIHYRRAVSHKISITYVCMCVAHLPLLLSPLSDVSERFVTGSRNCEIVNLYARAKSRVCVCLALFAHESFPSDSVFTRAMTYWSSHKTSVCL